MADKGFVIDKMLSEVGATLIMPPFKRGARFTSEETPKNPRVSPDLESWWRLRGPSEGSKNIISGTRPFL